MHYERRDDRLPIMDGADDFKPLQDNNAVRQVLNVHNRALGEYQNRIENLERQLLLAFGLIVFNLILLGCLVLLTILR